MQTTSPDAWGRLWPLLVTAALSLFVVLVVQLYVIPRVESLKRREDRWEDDVRQLGELITFDLADATSAYDVALYQYAYLYELDDSRYPAERVAELKRQNVLALRAARDQDSKTMKRIDWLADRVCAVDRTGMPMRQLRLAVMGLSVRGPGMVDPTYRGDGFELTGEQIDIAVKDRRELITDLTRQLESLGSRRPPRPISRGRRAWTSVRSVVRRRT